MNLTVYRLIVCEYSCAQSKKISAETNSVFCEEHSLAWDKHRNHCRAARK